MRPYTVPAVTVNFSLRSTVNVAVWSPVSVNETAETYVGAGPDFHSSCVTVVSLMPERLSIVQIGEVGGSVSVDGA
jgi:hypothetical protein